MDEAQRVWYYLNGNDDVLRVFRGLYNLQRFAGKVVAG